MAATQIIYNNVKNFAQLALANIQIMSAASVVTDGNGDISDLLLVGQLSNTQQILAAIKALIDNMVARNMLKIVTVAAGSVVVQFYVNFNSSLTAQSQMTLYSIDLSKFFLGVISTAPGVVGTYELLTNAVIYPGPSYNNPTYYANLTALQQAFHQLVTLINTIQNA